VLKNRLERKAEEKRIIPETQTGSRRESLIISLLLRAASCYTLYRVLQRKESRDEKPGKVYII